MSQLTFGLPIKSHSEGDALVKATKWGVFQTDWRMFKYFKPDFYKKYKKTVKRKIKRAEIIFKIILIF